MAQAWLRPGGVVMLSNPGLVLDVIRAAASGV